MKKELDQYFDDLCLEPLSEGKMKEIAIEAHDFDYLFTNWVGKKAEQASPMFRRKIKGFIESRRRKAAGDGSVRTKRIHPAKA